MKQNELHTNEAWVLCDEANVKLFAEVNVSLVHLVGVIPNVVDHAAVPASFEYL